MSNKLVFDFHYIQKYLQPMNRAINDLESIKANVETLGLSKSTGNSKEILNDLNKKVVENLSCRIDIMKSIVSYLNNTITTMKHFEDDIAAKISQ